jgi:sec-independent protein translocase protein TatA
MAPHWTGLIVVAILLLLLFGGRGKISSIMGDFAKGITSFRKGLKDEDEAKPEEPARPVTDERVAAEPAPRKDERAGS